ncbi:MAG TPA: adenosylcobinamide-GDP ribazoletransferase, partial [Acidimicrobiales bacterium]|nr:adenosylcobinamide-GDP ribazoletransferase [Acidimicrobiales bacterium]
GPSAVPDAGALAWFPLVGAGLGLAVGGLWWLAGRAWPAGVAAAVALAADAALTGALHLDGLADAGDGLLAPLPRARRLEVMADPAVGAFGAVTLAVVLVTRFAAFSSTTAVPLVVGGLWCASRTVMAVVPGTVPYARPGGLATAFLDADAGGPGRSLGARRRLVVVVVTGTVLSFGLAVAGRGGPGAAAVGAGVAAAVAVVALARRRLGGFTGDVLGAAGVVGETVGLLVLAARW